MSKIIGLIMILIGTVLSVCVQVWMLLQLNADITIWLSVLFALVFSAFGKFLVSD